MDKEVFRVGLYGIIISNLFQVFLLIVSRTLKLPLCSFYSYIRLYKIMLSREL